MIKDSIFEDALARPELFHWFGVNEAELDAWLRNLPFRVHPGLVSFWRRTGGGDVFESETLLGPLAVEEGDNVLQMSEFHWSKGLSRDLMLFHVGSFLSASHVDWPRHRNRLYALKPDTYEIVGQFELFRAWYAGTLRAEYANRYGL